MASLSVNMREAVQAVTPVRRAQVSIWMVVLCLAVGLLLRISPAQFREAAQLSDPELSNPEVLRQQLADLGITARTLAIASTAGYAIQNLVLIGISLILLLKRRTDDWFAFYLSIAMVASIGAVYPPSLSRMVDGQIGWMAVGKIMTVLWITSLFLLPLLFPNGRFVPRGMAVLGAYLVYSAVTFIVAPSRSLQPAFTRNPAVEAAVNLLVLAAVLFSAIYRYRRQASLVERQQMKWGAVGALIGLPAFLLGDALMRSIDGSFAGMLALLGFTIVMPIATLIFPLCLTVAILRYRLWDIDLVVSRTLVWLLMTALVGAAYIGLVFGIGSMFESDQSTVLSLLAIGLTAVLFQPVRGRMQRGIDRLFFGDRDDPYRVVRKLADDLAETIQPVEALRATVRTLTEALRLPYAAITFEPGTLPVAAAGHPGAVEVPFALTYQSQPVGELVVSPRSGSREFDAADRRLLEELARQIGVVAHNVRLTNDLQASRERIVTAREEERRRLRRDLHDGLGAQLAALTLQTGALKATIHRDPDAALTQATELQQELRVAVGDIRRLVQGLRPAALDDLGLTGALSARVATVNLGEGTDPGPPLLVSLEATNDLGDLPAAVEVASYRIVDEALANVVRHAHATRCVIRIAREPHGIVLTIEDNGTGIPPDRISGVGMQSMRERALELGGAFRIEAAEPDGTRIVAELPDRLTPGPSSPRPLLTLGPLPLGKGVSHRERESPSGERGAYR